MPPSNPWSFKLGKVAGIQLQVHVTFAVLLGWVAIRAVQGGGGWSAIVSALLLTVAVFFTVFLHELGHSLVAKKFGIRTLDIELTPMGAMSHLEHVPENPKHELLISLAGPLVSLCIALLLFVGLKVGDHLFDFDEVFDPRQQPVAAVMWLNLLLGLYNLLPIFPMDGGRGLRAVLAMRRSYPEATRIATRVAQVGSVVLAIVPGKFNLVFVLTAVWLWMSARHELRDVRERHTLRPFSVRDVMVKDPITLSTDDTLKHAASVFVSTFQSEFPVMQSESVAGLLGFDELLDGLEKHGENATVRQAMRALPDGIEVDSKVEEALTKLNENSEKTDSVLLVLEHDKLVGVVPLSNLKELLKVEKALNRTA
jgi:Zn-dependent protease/CBS domain-containing protein